VFSFTSEDRDMKPPPKLSPAASDDVKLLHCHSSVGSSSRLGKWQCCCSSG